MLVKPVNLLNMFKIWAYFSAKPTANKAFSGNRGLLAKKSGRDGCKMDEIACNLGPKTTFTESHRTDRVIFSV